MKALLQNEALLYFFIFIPPGCVGGFFFLSGLFSPSNCEFSVCEISFASFFCEGLRQLSGIMLNVS